LLAGLAVTAPEARRQLEAAVESGAALAKFREIVIAQGGDPRVMDEPARLPQARYQRPVKCARGGTVQAVDAWQVARVALELGAGRTLLEERIDPAVGVSRLLKVGESVPTGGDLCVVHANDESKLDHARKMLAKAITVGESVASAPKLIDEILE
jgi:pyrimidine-nucleoside phosphorylase